MPKFMVINDPHVSDRPPIGRTESYADDIFAKLTECWKIAAQEKCNFIIFTGDIYHRFRGPMVAYATTIRLLALFREAPCSVYAVAGNHDLTMDGVASVWKMPFGVLAKAGAFTWLSEAAVDTCGQPTEQVILIPRNWEPQIDRLPSIFKLKQAELEMREQCRGVRYIVMVTHAAILPPGRDAIYPHHNADKLPTDQLDILICGHIHEDLGICQLPSGCWYANIGSLARVSRTKEALIRRIDVLTVTLEDGNIEFERHPLQSARPAKEVFFEKDAVTEREVGDFAAALSTALELEETPISELVAQYTKGQPSTVVEKLHYYLEGGDVQP